MIYCSRNVLISRNEKLNKIFFFIFDFYKRQLNSTIITIFLLMLKRRFYFFTVKYPL